MYNMSTLTALYLKGRVQSQKEEHRRMVAHKSRTMVKSRVRREVKSSKVKRRKDEVGERREADKSCRGMIQ